MVSPKQLLLLAAAGVAASLFLAQPARALAALAQPYLTSIDQGRVNAVQPIGHHRCHIHRDGWHSCRHGGSRDYYKSPQKSRSHWPSQRSGSYKP